MFFFCKQKTAYDMRISDWSSDVCSSDLHAAVQDDPTVELLRLMARLQPPAALPSGTGSVIAVVGPRAEALELATALALQVGSDPDDVMIEIGRASCRERVCQYV